MGHLRADLGLCGAQGESDGRDLLERQELAVRELRWWVDWMLAQPRQCRFLEYAAQAAHAIRESARHVRPRAPLLFRRKANMASVQFLVFPEAPTRRQKRELRR